MILLVVVAIVYVGGCTQMDPIRWAPSESQKQNADLAVQAARSMEDVAPPSHAKVAKIGVTATKTTKRYFGEPKEPVFLEEPAADEAMEQAEDDAVQRPTLEEGASYAVDRTAGIVGSLLAGAASIAGIWGAGKVRNKLIDYRRQANQLGQSMKETVHSVSEAMTGVLTQEQVDAFKQVLREQQSKETKAQIAQAKHPSP